MNRVYVVGFDGATWRFIRPLIDSGEMPHFARLMTEGVHGELTSTIPFQSAAAWVTFMTGKNPGKTGVYMFQDYDALSYSYVGRTANSRYFSGQTIFDAVGRLGGTVASVRVPISYPAWPVNGVMVSGFPTPGDTTDSFYPPELRQELGFVGEADPPDFRLLSTADQVQTLETHMNRVSHLVEMVMQKTYDLFVVVHRVPDPIHHFFIKFVDPETPAYNEEAAKRWGDVVNGFYRKIDAALGETVDRLSPDDTLFVISDHGGAITPPRQLNLNVWLAQQGLLSPKERTRSLTERIYALNQKFIPSRIRSILRRHAPKGVQGELRGLWQGLQAIDFSRTQAYMFPMKCPPLTGIAINVRGRQPEGTVAPEAYETFRERIMGNLTNLRDPNTGESIVQAVYKREDLYHGEFVDRAPDIILWCNHLYKEGPFADGPLVNEVPFDELKQVPGSHDEKGIFLAKGPGIASGKRIDGARLIDVTPTILHAMELPVPSDMDGSVLQDIFEATREAESVELSLERQSAESYLSEDEEQLIKDKLKGWGYM